jgi:hypothetical protein
VSLRETWVWVAPSKWSSLYDLLHHPRHGTGLPLGLSSQHTVFHLELVLHLRLPSFLPFYSFSCAKASGSKKKELLSNCSCFFFYWLFQMLCFLPHIFTIVCSQFKFMLLSLKSHFETFCAGLQSFIHSSVIFPCEHIFMASFLLWWSCLCST